MPLNAPRKLRPVPDSPIPPGQLKIPQTDDIMRTVASALAENRLLCAFQPVVTAARPDVISFYECLARIIDRNGDVIPAGRFVPAIEGSDLGRLIDRAVLRAALDVLATHSRVRLSINLSATGLCDRSWLEILQQADATTPGIGDFLIVEVTESAFIDMTPDVLAFLDELRQLGCSVALDDFGAGHTSIGHLTKFRFDFLKIDGSFIVGIAENADNQFLVKSMVSIARHFEMVCVAEMVDCDADIAMLRDLGVDCLQGYHVGMPVMDPPGSHRRQVAHG